MGDLDVMEVAKFFMEKALAQNISLSKNKLTDLLWQANGFWVGLKNRPLFSESFRYSPHGVFLISIIDNYELIMCRTMSYKINASQNQLFLNKIWRMFGELSDDFLRYLSNMRQLDNEIPKFNKPDDYKKIDVKVISEYFKNELKDYWGIEVKNV